MLTHPLRPQPASLAPVPWSRSARTALGQAPSKKVSACPSHRPPSFETKSHLLLPYCSVSSSRCRASRALTRATPRRAWTATTTPTSPLSRSRSRCSTLSNRTSGLVAGRLRSPACPPDAVAAPGPRNSSAEPGSRTARARVISSTLPPCRSTSTRWGTPPHPSFHCPRSCSSSAQSPDAAKAYAEASRVLHALADGTVRLFLSARSSV